MNEEQEQKNIEVEGERARRLKESSDWIWAKQKLMDMMVAVLSLETLTDYKTASALQLEITSRKRATGLVKAWIEEVEGSGVQQQINKPKQLTQSDLITRFEEE